MTEGSDIGSATAVLTAISAAVQTVKNVAGMIKSALPEAGANQAALNEARELTISVKSALLDAKEEILRLKREVLRLESENAELLTKLREKEEWPLEREKYETKTAGKDRVVVRKDEPEQFYCLACFSSQKLSPLVGTGFGAGESAPTHRCVTCEGYYHLT